MDATTFRLETGRRLLQAGVLLFLLGLVTGFALPLFTGEPLESSRRLELAMNGALLIGVGLLWPNVNLSRRASRFAYLIALGAAWLNWLALTIATGADIPHQPLFRLSDFRVLPLLHTGLGALVAVVLLGTALVALMLLRGLRQTRFPIPNPSARQNARDRLIKEAIDD